MHDKLCFKSDRGIVINAMSMLHYDFGVMREYCLLRSKSFSSRLIIASKKERAKY